MTHFKYPKLILYCKGYFEPTRRGDDTIDIFVDFRKYLDDYILTTDADVYQKVLDIAVEYADVFDWNIKTFINQVRERMTMIGCDNLTWQEAVLWEVYSAIQRLPKSFM